MIDEKRKEIKNAELKAEKFFRKAEKFRKTAMESEKAKDFKKASVAYDKASKAYYESVLFYYDAGQISKRDKALRLDYQAIHKSSHSETRARKLGQIKEKGFLFNDS